MVEVGKTVQFNDTSTGTVSLSQWDFGDGSAPISGLSVTHVYTNPGNFTVTHNVTGGTGQVQSCVQTISVTPSAPGTIFGYDWKTVALAGTAGVAVLAIIYGMSRGRGEQQMMPQRRYRQPMYGGGY